MSRGNMELHRLTISHRLRPEWPDTGRLAGMDHQAAGSDPDGNRTMSLDEAAHHRLFPVAVP